MKLIALILLSVGLQAGTIQWTPSNVAAVLSAADSVIHIEKTAGSFKTGMRHVGVALTHPLHIGAAVKASDEKVAAQEAAKKAKVK
jgi:hypothetical protein